jgi:hypothetical protein
MKQTLRAAMYFTSAILGASVAPSAHAAGDWEWMVAPYVWGPSVGTDLRTTVPPEGGISNDTDFSNVIDKLEGAFLIHIEGQGETFGVYADFTYLGLGDTRTFERFESESDLDARLFDAAAVWSPGAGAFDGWELYGGLRYIDVDATLRFDPVNPAFSSTTFDAGDSFSDFLIGTRYLWKINDRWGMSLRGDTSFGDTEGTYSLAVTGSYRTGNGAWYFGYKYFSLELETGNTNTELTLSGPLVGYGFRF